MADLISPMSNNSQRSVLTRFVLPVLGIAIAAAPQALMAQGQCLGRPTQNTPVCDTMPVKAPFASTGWKTVALDHFTMHAVDYKKEAAYYMALMNWKLRSDDGTKAVLDIGDIGSVVIIGGYQPPPPPPAPPPRVLSAADSAALAARGGGAGRGGRGGVRPSPQAVWDSFSWEIAPWNAKKVEAELKKRGLNPVADNSEGPGCESFHVKDPDGFDLQISNGCFAKARKSAPKAVANWTQPAPFENTNWHTVWLDHISFGVSDYKGEVAFYTALIGWKGTSDEGSQNETIMCDACGNSLIRGGNSLSPKFDKSAPRRASIGHISFGISPFDA
jgi:predicted enzyme related to lactoylglutathione lyase